MRKQILVWHQHQKGYQEKGWSPQNGTIYQQGAWWARLVHLKRESQKICREAYNHFVADLASTDPNGNKRLGALVKSLRCDQPGVIAGFDIGIRDSVWGQHTQLPVCVSLHRGREHPSTWTWRRNLTLRTQDSSALRHYGTIQMGLKCLDISAPVLKCPKDTLDLSTELSSPMVQNVPHYSLKCWKTLMLWFM